MFRGIQANFFFFIAHFDRGDLVDQPQSGIAEDEGVGSGDDSAEGFEQEEGDVPMACSGLLISWASEAVSLPIAASRSERMMRSSAACRSEMSRLLMRRPMNWLLAE